MYLIVLFFEIGSLFSLLSIFYLIYNIYRRKHTEGISFNSQLLYAISHYARLFYFPFTSLVEYKFSWLIIIISVIFPTIILIQMVKYTPLSSSLEKNKVDYRIIILIAFILSVISNYSKEYDWSNSQLALRFSIILESFALLPQLLLMKKEQYIQQFIGYYILFITISRVFRILFWISQYQDNNDISYKSLFIADGIYIVLTADFIYRLIKHRKSNLIPFN